MIALACSKCSITEFLLNAGLICAIQTDHHTHSAAVETSTSPEVEGVTKVILLPFTHHTSLIARPCDRVRPGNEAITLSMSLKCKILSGYCQYILKILSVLLLSVYFKIYFRILSICLRIPSIRLRIPSICLRISSVCLRISSVCLRILSACRRILSVYKLSVFQLTVGGGGLEIVAVVLGDRGLLLGVWPLERL